MQAYYDDRLGADQELFTTDGISGGIRFDRNNVSDTLDNAKGYTKYFINCLLTLPVTERATIITQLPNLRDWFIQAGSQAMRATADDQRAFMLGGTGNDILTGGTQADLLVGGTGNDYLDGGTGDDTLIGGEGIDTYVISGHDRIIDTGRNNIVYNGRLIAGAFKINSSSGAYEFISDDQGYQINFPSPGQLTISDTDSVTFVKQTSAGAFADHDFGISLLEEDSNDFDISLTGTAYRDEMQLEYIDSNWELTFTSFPDEQSSYTPFYDEYLSSTAPRMKINGGETHDYLFGFIRHDEISGGGGGDIITGYLGWWDDLEVDLAGDMEGDLLDGGSGDDWIQGTGGNDQLIGGAGNDLLSSFDGDDSLRGDGGNDVLAGASHADVLSGGDGDDILVGGVGNDSLYGDYPGISADAYGNDYLDGGAGDDQLAGGNDDILVGGSGSDILIGGSQVGNGQYAPTDDYHWRIAA